MLKLACVSDIHLFHKRNSTAGIIKALDTEFINNPETAQLDILFIAGDVFDRLVDLHEEEVSIVSLWFADLMRFCEKHDIVLRILEGTPSHDWCQSELFITMSSVLKLKHLDIDYIRNIHLERNEKLGIDILYIPDEIKPTTEETLQCVKDLLREHHIDKVDFIVMHGMFDYQAPPGIKNIPKHDSNEYMKLVKHFIFIGHVHTHTLFDKIVAQGSFDRLKHGEEEPKGYVKAFVDLETCRSNVFFIENKLARQYKTIVCTDEDLESSIAKIKQIVEPLNFNACVRIQAETKHPIFTNMNVLTKMFPTITWSKLAKDAETIKKEIEQVEEKEFVPITISRENIIQLLTPRLSLVFNNTDMLHRCNDIMESTLR